MYFCNVQLSIDRTKSGVEQLFVEMLGDSGTIKKTFVFVSNINGSLLNLTQASTDDSIRSFVDLLVIKFA